MEHKFCGLISAKDMSEFLGAKMFLELSTKKYMNHQANKYCVFIPTGECMEQYRSQPNEDDDSFWLIEKSSLDVICRSQSGRLFYRISTALHIEAFSLCQ
ncbi:hypothetical protein PRJ48_004714 [Salmonella enterica]|nr:hypothetical protein [Salmonella enterica]